MVPFVALLIGTAVARLVGLAGVHMLDGWQPALRIGLALMFALTGSAHFSAKMHRDMVEMVPPAMPNPELLVIVTGVLELAGAVGLLLPMTARLAAACLALLVLAMFPANVSAARRNLQLGGKPVTPLVPRTIEQIVFVAAAAAVAVW
ncbi:DoxX family membrane protein [Nocardia sp. CWNU-33]|uniref:DoxX family protein n=1 Tax=Nocardia sp. CWNU-33 TaxID=3392117 RepID=UPI00398E4738